jgi:hypothetical protein
MTLLDGALIALVVVLVSGVVAVIWRLLRDEDGDGHPDGPWPRWSARGRR